MGIISGRVRRKMSFVWIGGGVLGVIASMIWGFSIFKTFFDVWWIDGIIGFTIFFVGAYVLESQIDRICGTIEEESEKRGKTNEKQTEETK